MIWVKLEQVNGGFFEEVMFELSYVRRTELHEVKMVGNGLNAERNIEEMTEGQIS